MRETSALYKKIIESPLRRFETRVSIAGTDYEEDSIESMSVLSDLFKEFSIGNVVARQFTLVLRDWDSIPKGAKVVPYVRVVNDVTRQASEWLKKGVFYVYSRTEDVDGEYLALTGYDALMRSDVPFFKTGTWVSTDALDVAQAIAEDIGTSLESSTYSLLKNDPVSIPYIPVMGEDGTTDREMLQYIAAAYCGNWIIDDDGKLKLVCFKDTPSSTHYLINEHGYNITFGGTRILV